ncbi:hypothetical protein EVAR_59942_1 [Eumeta japonica]|uniref:Uncharacterized protein n=1 Tax=Eumeta variegata TaxID=151549 RepID=A0A4C1ZID3_EUMVA|nr:hypothetical protein EVAR_59942_1 [Eumeta japonica]
MEERAVLWPTWQHVNGPARAMGYLTLINGRNDGGEPLVSLDAARTPTARPSAYFLFNITYINLECPRRGRSGGKGVGQINPARKFYPSQIETRPGQTALHGSRMRRYPVAGRT